MQNVTGVVVLIVVGFLPGFEISACIANCIISSRFPLPCKVHAKDVSIGYYKSSSRVKDRLSTISGCLKQQKIDRTSEGPMTFPDVATYESAFRDVACIKNQLLELQRIINNSVATDHIAESDEVHRNGVSVERLLKENDALRKELAEKDRIINTLRAQIALN